MILKILCLKRDIEKNSKEDYAHRYPMMKFLISFFLKVNLLGVIIVFLRFEAIFYLNIGKIWFTEKTFKPIR